MPARMSGAEFRVDPLAINQPKAMLSLAPFHQTGAVVRHVLVRRNVLAGDEEAAGAFHPRATKRNRLTRSAGLLAAVLAVVTAPTVVLVA